MSTYKNDKPHFVYEIKFPDGMRYIGCTYNIHQRFKTHATNPNKALRPYLRKSGYTFHDADLSVLEIAENKSEGHTTEKKYLNKFYKDNLLINNHTLKKKRAKFEVKMPNGDTETVKIIKESIFKPSNAQLKEAGK